MNSELGQLNFPNLNKLENLTEIALSRLKQFEPPEGYYLAFSGGKDSIVVYDLAVKAQVKFDTHYAQGGIDPPELVQFIRKNYPTIHIERPAMSIWRRIQTKGMPRRQARWCCEFIKEHNGAGRRVLTGIRWAESSRRANRMMVEVCRTDDTKIFIHPIIDWQEQDVWDYIHHENVAYCSLYDEGFKRLGCVLCPMKTPQQTQIELSRFPELAEAWRRACYRYWGKGIEGTKRWKSPEDMWQWWLSRRSEPKVNKAQCIMFDN